jgi:hypothetical protein
VVRGLSSSYGGGWVRTSYRRRYSPTRWRLLFRYGVVVLVDLFLLKVAARLDHVGSCSCCVLGVWLEWVFYACCVLSHGVVDMWFFLCLRSIHLSSLQLRILTQHVFFSILVSNSFTDSLGSACVDLSLPLFYFLPFKVAFNHFEVGLIVFTFYGLFGMKEEKWEERKLRKPMNEFRLKINPNSFIDFRNLLSLTFFPSKQTDS